MKKTAYLDNNATTVIDPRVEQAFLDALKIAWANPSSIHRSGQEARAQLVTARKRISNFFGFRESEVIFTSSGTEALNTVLRGFFGFKPHGHIVTSDVEHAAVYNTVQTLEKAGARVTYLKVGLWGAPRVEAVQEALRPDTTLIVLMAANNETGVRTDIDAIAEVALQKKIPFVVDGVAILGKDTFAVHPGISAICFSGHKIHAPKGAGVALVRKEMKLEPYLTGGGQEGGMRSGTENVPVIVAFSKALEIIEENGKDIVEKIQWLRLLFEEKLLVLLQDIEIHGAGPRISNTSNICFPGVDGEALLMYLDIHGVAASLGSACMSGAQELSRVLMNMGISREKTASSVRFSFSRFNTQDDVEYSVNTIIEGVQKLR